MKKNNYIYIVLFIVITLVLFFPMGVFAEKNIIGCKYILSIGSEKDSIIFYYEDGKGFNNQFKIGPNKYEFSSNRSLSTVDGKVFANKNIHIDKEQINDIFNKNITSCPSGLSYITFAKGMFTDYVLVNGNYNSNLIDNTSKGTIEYSETIGNTIEVNKRVNCGDELVVAMNSSKEASSFNDKALKLQFYYENNKYYVEITIQNYTQSGELKTFELSNNNINYIDYYKINYGGRVLAIQRPTYCSNNKIVSCDQDNGDGELKTYVGPDCNFSGNGFEDTEHNVDSYEEYIDNYKKPEQKSLIDYENPCKGDVLKAMKVLSKVLVVLKIIVPLLIIVFGMIDFGKAVISSDEKAISTSTKTLIKRFIAGVIIFIIPTLVLAIMDVIHLSDEVSSFEACTACLLNSDRCN